MFESTAGNRAAKMCVPLRPEGLYGNCAHHTFCLLLGTIAASGVCLKCGTSLNLASHDLQHELREAYANLKVAHDLQFKDVEQARIKAQQASEQLHRLVWPTHHLQVDATQLWQTTLLLQLDKGPSLKQAAHLASQLCHHMDQILPPSSPILAVQHYTAAKLILAIRSTLTAEEHLEVTKALRFVQLTQGINSSLYTSLENDLAACAMANL
ncbi:hypothetical protein H4R35_002362 [Dimargaris xerosporica]|nr:hypothetical protein H4R35_002362 [Dimargaris xerosporica]